MGLPNILVGYLIVIFLKVLLMSIPRIALFSVVLFFVGCGGTSYWDSPLDSAELQGKSQAWFEENWGTPSAKAQRFFGGETWVYFRIAEQKKTFSFFNYESNDCQISLDFDKGGKLEDSGYSGC